jgi:hypothetical protein
MRKHPTPILILVVAHMKIFQYMHGSMHGYGRSSYMVDVDFKNEFNLRMPVQKN